MESRILGVPNSGAWAYLARVLLDPTDPLCKALGPGLRGPIVVVREKEEDLEDVRDAFLAFSILPPKSRTGPAPAFFGEEESARLAAVERLYAGAPLALATRAALALPCPDAAEHAARRLVLSPGPATPRRELLARLDTTGYRRVDFVESPGEYAARGAVVDFFPEEPRRGVRVLYDGDRIETLREFDPATQAGSPGTLDEAVVCPAREASGTRSLAQALKSRGLWIVEEALELPCEPGRCLRVSGASEAEAGDLELGAVSRFPAGAGIEAAVRFCRERRAAGLEVLLFSMNRGEDERISELFEESGLGRGAQFLVGPLRQGFEIARRGVAVLSSAEILGRSYRPARAWRGAWSGRARARWGELRRGDFVVHELYGIARYLGLDTVATRDDPESITAAPVRRDGTRRLGAGPPEGAEAPVSTMDCLKLEFRGRDTLFVPMAEFRAVQKYAGSEGHRPRLSSLDTRGWESVRERVREGVRELAEQLLKVHAARKALPGHAFGPRTGMEEEFARSFPYEETPDQRKAIEEVEADMEAPHPMDRVVVGDVGFGKTEVAMRAALKCAAGARQACLLVPTTILADQHARTFRARFAEYPVRVGMLSRFQTRSEQQSTLAELAKGALDVLIGTHRVLQKDVRFKSLGLLIIDEEHRFGVAAKEEFKRLRREVDSLSLSATPIPRTLNQCLSGLRQLSLIASAPSGRQPIATGLRPYEPAHVAAAIRDELARGGQIFYVHNRVRSLPETVRELEALVPEARFTMAHGKLRAEKLEAVMWEFSQRKHDVLVASSIIESGLDIPSVNTLLIENAQDFGLSQLYQLRGRIGRERSRAFCYLYYPSELKAYRELGEEARLRLEALRDFADLGSGFSLALRDLEIRGAGDLLGAKQHGYLNAVGVEFYSELLSEEIARVKSGAAAPAPPAAAHLDLSVPAYLPKEYLPGDLERIQFYKRLLAAEPAELDGLRRELADLSGPPPAAVENLLSVVRIRAAATRAGVRLLVQRGGRIEVYFRPETQVPVETITRWVGAYGDHIEFVRSPEGDGVRIWIKDRTPMAWIVDFLDGLLRAGRGR